jgi:uncharacterized protein (TIGR02246 family)
VRQANFNRWLQALLSRDYEQVASLYSTEEPDFVRDTKSTKQHFLEFLQKLPKGTITADKVQKYSDDVYLHTGMYTFMTGPEGDRTNVNARFSYMWRNFDGQWKITHHHSSTVPSAPGQPVEQPKGGEAVDFEMGPAAEEAAQQHTGSEAVDSEVIPAEPKQEVKTVEESVQQTVGGDVWDFKVGPAEPKQDAKINGQHVGSMVVGFEAGAKQAVHTAEDPVQEPLVVDSLDFSTAATVAREMPRHALGSRALSSPVYSPVHHLHTRILLSILRQRNTQHTIVNESAPLSADTLCSEEMKEVAQASTFQLIL